jgi:hypothetical protein
VILFASRFGINVLVRKFPSGSLRQAASLSVQSGRHCNQFSVAGINVKPRQLVDPGRPFEPPLHVLSKPSCNHHFPTHPHLTHIHSLLLISLCTASLSTPHSLFLRFITRSNRITALCLPTIPLKILCLTFFSLGLPLRLKLSI